MAPALHRPESWIFPASYKATVIEAVLQCEVDILNEPPLCVLLCGVCLLERPVACLESCPSCWRRVVSASVLGWWISYDLCGLVHMSLLTDVMRRLFLYQKTIWAVVIIGEGIRLLDVVGKLCGRIVQKRLHTIIEAEVPKTQCGFRAGHGCPDAVFYARQLGEKAFEHWTKIFLLFIDLISYNSVPRPTLWIALRCLGVNPAVVDLIKCFHEDMDATVCVSNISTDPIRAQNRLRQCCIMPHVLFNLYCTVVLERHYNLMAQHSAPSGMELRVSINDNLFPDRLAVPQPRMTVVLIWSALMMPYSVSHLERHLLVTWLHLTRREGV